MAQEPLAGTIFLVDDEPDVRASLGRLLRSVGLHVRAFESAQEFLAEFPCGSPGCLLLDVNMPDMSGPDLHEALNARGFHLPIVYLTGRSSVSLGVRAMKKGAFDFLEKPVDADELIAVISQALERGRALEARRQSNGDIQRRMGLLSVREREVMALVVKGRLNKQIAGELGIAEKTVKVHRSRVMTKMRVRSVAELVHQCDQLESDWPPRGGE